MGVNTGMNQALLGNNPLATIQGVCVCVCVRDRKLKCVYFRRVEEKKRKLSISTDKQNIMQRSQLRWWCTLLFHFWEYLRVTEYIKIRRKEFFYVLAIHFPPVKHLNHLHTHKLRHDTHTFLHLKTRIAQEKKKSTFLQN